MPESDDGDVPEVPVVCPACGTEVRVPLPAVAETVERHNDERHGGEEVAEVDPAVRDRLADLIASDLDLIDPGDRG